MHLFPSVKQAHTAGPFNTDVLLNRCLLKEWVPPRRLRIFPSPQNALLCQQMGTCWIGDTSFLSSKQKQIKSKNKPTYMKPPLCIGIKLPRPSY